MVAAVRGREMDFHPWEELARVEHMGTDVGTERWSGRDLRAYRCRRVSTGIGK